MRKFLTLIVVLYTISTTSAQLFVQKVGNYYHYSDGYQITANDFLESEHLSNFAISTFREGNTTEAISVAQQAIRFNKHNDEAHYCLGKAFCSQKNYQEATSNFLKCTKIKPDSSEYWAMLGDAQLELGIKQDSLSQIMVAITSMTQAIKIDSYNARYWIKRAWAQYYVGNNKGAVNDLRKAIKINPTIAEPYHLHATIYLKEGNKKESIKAITKAIMLEPSKSEYWLFRSDLKRDVDNIGAKADLDSAIIRDSDCAMCYFNRAQLRSDLPEYDEVGEIYDYYKAKEILNGNDTLYHGLNTIIDWTLIRYGYMSKYHLITIGIGNYQNKHLFKNIDFAIPGVLGFQQVFAKKNILHGKVELLNSNATRSNIIQTLKKLKDEGFQNWVQQDDGGWFHDESGGVIIFYFFGHGLTVNGKPGICPYDYSSESDLIDYQTLSDLVADIDGSKNVLIIEACSNTIDQNDNEISDSVSIKTFTPPENLVCYFSNEIGKLSKGDNTQGGYFNKALVTAFDKKSKANFNGDDYITFEEFFNYIQKEVQQKSGGYQIPQMKAPHPKSIFFKN